MQIEKMFFKEFQKKKDQKCTIADLNLPMTFHEG